MSEKEWQVPPDPPSFATSTIAAAAATSTTNNTAILSTETKEEENATSPRVTSYHVLKDEDKRTRFSSEFVMMVDDTSSSCSSAFIVDTIGDDMNQNSAQKLDFFPLSMSKNHSMYENSKEKRKVKKVSGIGMETIEASTSCLGEPKDNSDPVYIFEEDSRKKQKSNDDDSREEEEDEEEEEEEESNHPNANGNVRKSIKKKKKKQKNFWRFPKHWVRLMYRRFHADFDSYVLVSTFLIALVTVCVTITVSVILSSSESFQFHSRCELVSKKDQHVPINTISIASALVPIGNHVVTLIVSFWVAVLCSMSRKKIATSSPNSMSISLISAFMLPCYELIWYTISGLSCIGLFMFIYSFSMTKKVIINHQTLTTTITNSSSSSIHTIASTTKNRIFEQQNHSYPCELNSLPYVWILQLLPLLMVQRSVAKPAVLRSIGFSGLSTGCLVFFFWIFQSKGNVVIGGIYLGMRLLLMLFFVWAKFVYHARATFDFFFITAIASSLIRMISEVIVMTDTHGASEKTLVSRCIANCFDSLLIVAILLSLRADTKYWLGIDDGSLRTRHPMRKYMHQLSERGMITVFSTRTSVYDVHHMIEEHRKNVVDFSVLRLESIIAQGATAIVMKGQMRSSIQIALKIYTSIQVAEEEMYRFSRETALNVQLSHPNVVKFYGLCVVPPSISLVFEFCENGALDVALNQKNKKFWTLSMKLKAWLDACQAVAYLHSFRPPLLHRDIKTGNFLLAKDFVLKLADFGESNLLRPRSDGTMTIAGTVDYMAPEMILGGKTARYGTAADVYSLTITLWQILFPKRSPWGEGCSHLEVYNAVIRGDRPPLTFAYGDEDDDQEIEDEVDVLENGGLSGASAIVSGTNYIHMRRQKERMPKACEEILQRGWAPDPADRMDVEDMIPRVHQLWLFSMHHKKLKRTKLDPSSTKYL